jgi:hypothetical protein
MRLCAAWRLLLSVTLLATACGGSGPPPTSSTPAPSEPTSATTTQPVVEAMLAQLETKIAGFLSSEQTSLPRNPHIETWIRAKIAMLQDPNLATQIRSGRLYATGEVQSSKGARIPIVAVFPMESMRTEATEMVQRGGLTVPVLESFIGVPFPPGSIQIWYGFATGSSGGGGTLNLEDRTTYTARTAVRPALALYDAIFDHELTHTYIGHESLTGFLEILVYNQIETGSPDVPAWRYTKGEYVAFRSTNTGWLALIDVYQVLGRDATARAYRAIYPLKPPYGAPLSAECKQKFVDEAPPGEASRVAAILERVVY